MFDILQNHAYKRKEKFYVFSSSLDFFAAILYR